MSRNGKALSEMVYVLLKHCLRFIIHNHSVRKLMQQK